MSEFISWAGGEQPVPNLTKVEVQFRDNSYAFLQSYAMEIEWFHVEPDDTTFDDDSGFDVVGYRTLEDQGGDWIQWNGGENPVPEQPVEVIFRGFTYVYEDASEVFDWTHVPDEHDVDIVLYRVLK